MRSPFKTSGTSDGPGPKPNNSWLKFVTDAHLDWLMDMILRMQRGEVLDADEAECYNIIKEQALTFMAQAEAEHWSEEERLVRVGNAWIAKVEARL